VQVTLPGEAGPVSHGVDTGFLVYNERTYPRLIALFAELGVQTAEADMSFSVRALDRDRSLEWAGSNLGTVFAQRSNVLRPKFWKMLRELLRLNALCTQLAEKQADDELRMPLSDFLLKHRFGREIQDWYLLPMLGCIWSCPTEQMLQFPTSTMIRFCHNHGLMQITGRPKWRTVAGGSKHYVDAIIAGIQDARLNSPVQRIERTSQGIRVSTLQGSELFNHVIIATHAPQALSMLADASAEERDVLGAFRTQSNLAVLHTDTSVLPVRRKVWSAWNYAADPAAGPASRVGLHYLINKLQPLPFVQPVIVSLNPARAIDAHQVQASIEYAHPVMDIASREAQDRLGHIQGRNNTWFCGAWTRYGFHEDGLMSGQAAARDILQRLREAR
jgi:predicted NAD/FAD-binding protein